MSFHEKEKLVSGLVNGTSCRTTRVVSLTGFIIDKKTRNPKKNDYGEFLQGSVAIKLQLEKRLVFGRV